MRGKGKKRQTVGPEKKKIKKGIRATCGRKKKKRSRTFEKKPITRDLCELRDGHRKKKRHQERPRTTETASMGEKGGGGGGNSEKKRESSLQEYIVTTRILRCQKKTGKNIRKNIAG